MTDNRAPGRAWVSVVLDAAMTLFEELTARPLPPNWTPGSREGGSPVAIMPHCVVCGFGPGYQPVEEVTFADYEADWPHPRSANGSPIVGWSNSLGITAPPGVGLFCRAHFARARRLRHLPSAVAVEMMRAGTDGGFSGLLRRLRFPRRGA